MMKRQRRHHIFDNYENYESDICLQKQPSSRIESTIEAHVQDGETLQALALRFHCTVSEIKRLNKIDKDNEIYARKTIKVPLTPYSILLETLPNVHKSGQSSPKNQKNDQITTDGKPFEDENLNEKLLIASVNLSGINSNTNQINGKPNSIDYIISNSKLKIPNERILHKSKDERDSFNIDTDDLEEPLLSGIVDETIPQPRVIPVPSSKGAFDCSGSDCDISWICLFICILALCFAVPLIYVLYIAEHPDKFHHNSN